MAVVYKHYEQIYSTFTKTNDNTIVPKLHYHNVYEIYFLVNGSRTYTINGRLYKINKGEVVLVPPKAVHQTAGSEYSRYVLYFNKNYLSRFFSDKYIDSMLDVFKLKHLIPSKEDSELLLKLFTAIYKYDQESKPNEIIALLPVMFSILRRSASDENNGNRLANEQLDRILNYIESNYSTITSLDELADALYISKYHLSHIFKKGTGIPIMSYIYNLKLSYSCHLLTTTKKSIAIIAMESGFTSQITYCNLFKAKFNCSPLAYRKQINSTPPPQNFQ